MNAELSRPDLFATVQSGRIKTGIVQLGQGAKGRTWSRCLCASLRTCVRVCLSLCACVYFYVFSRVNVCACVDAHAGMCACVHVCAWVRAYVRVHTCV